MNEQLVCFRRVGTSMASACCTARTPKACSAWRTHSTNQQKPSPRMIGFLASHVGSVQRLQLLRHCLESISAQQTPLDMLYISWSASADLGPSVEVHLRKLKHPDKVCALRQRTKLSQYEHLREAARAAMGDCCSPDEEDTWCCFSDDDDLWHPLRVEAFRCVCAARSASSATGVSLGVYAQPTAAADGKEPVSAAEVDDMLRRGSATVHYAPGSEVFLLAVRLSLLSAFLEAAPRALLQNKFADTRFASHVVRENKRTMHHVEPTEIAAVMDAGTNAGARANRAASGCWLYYYRKDSSQASDGVADSSVVDDGDQVRASDSITPTAEDRKLTRDLMPPGTPEEILEEMVVGAAALRHTVDMCILLCLHLRNAKDLAIARLQQLQPELGLDPAAVAQGSPARAICERLASEALCKFEHRGAALPMGRLEDV